jgi:hypothetical protein
MEICIERIVPWIKSKSTIRSILTHHRQNPTEIIYGNMYLELEFGVYTISKRVFFCSVLHHIDLYVHFLKIKMLLLQIIYKIHHNSQKLFSLQFP